MRHHKRLLELLDLGFYVDNLYKLASLCKKLSLDTPRPAAFFIMESIFLNVARNWEDRPLTDEEAQQVESKLMRPLKELIEALEESSTNEEVLERLDEVVSAYWVSKAELRYPH